MKRVRFGDWLCTFALGVAAFSPWSSPTPQAHAAQSPIRVLAYNYGVMERVARVHANPAYARTGDYVRGFAPRPLCGASYSPGCVDGYTAVNWRTRGLVARNGVIVADVYSPRLGTWVRERLQPTDWQRREDSTGDVQRLEVDGYTAARLGFYGRATHAAIVGWEEDANETD